MDLLFDYFMIVLGLLDLANWKLLLWVSGFFLTVLYLMLFLILTALGLIFHLRTLDPLILILLLIKLSGILLPRTLILLPLFLALKSCPLKIELLLTLLLKLFFPILGPFPPYLNIILFSLTSLYLSIKLISSSSSLTI